MNIQHVKVVKPKHFKFDYGSVVPNLEKEIKPLNIGLLGPVPQAATQLKLHGCLLYLHFSDC